MSGPKPEKLAEWTHRFERFARSNQTVSAFCQDEEVSEPSFYHWKSRFRNLAPPENFQPVHVANLAGGTIDFSGPNQNGHPVGRRDSDSAG